jgi:hypothetical protein
MAEQRVDGTGFDAAQKLVYGGGVSGVGDRIDGESTLNMSGSVVYNQLYTMRAWSASLGIFVTWVATILDATASQYTGLGTPLSDIVLLKTR